MEKLHWGLESEGRNTHLQTSSQRFCKTHTSSSMFIKPIYDAGEGDSDLERIKREADRALAKDIEFPHCLRASEWVTKLDLLLLETAVSLSLCSIHYACAAASKSGSNRTGYYSHEPGSQQWHFIKTQVSPNTPILEVWLIVSVQPHQRALKW